MIKKPSPKKNVGPVRKPDFGVDHDGRVSVRFADGSSLGSYTVESHLLYAILQELKQTKGRL